MVKYGIGEGTALDLFSLLSEYDVFKAGITF